MKNFYYFLIVSIFCIEINAQTIPVGENINLDQQLSNVNQTSVTSGIIYERAMQIANIYNFNKTATFNTANFNYFKQVLSEMNSASNGTKFTTLDNFKSLISSTALDNEVDLAILNTQYHVLNYNEENTSLGGLTFDTTTNKFVQISGKVPFYMLDNTIISTTKDFAFGTSLTYKIRNDLYFKNGTKNIKTLIANFGDGINRTIISNQLMTNQNIRVNYTTSGEKVTTYTITYTDNTTLTTYSKMYFQFVDTTASLIQANSCFANDPLKQDFVLQADIPFTGYAIGDPTIKAKIEYRVFYSDGNTQKKIKKPIIIIDGFDPGDKRKIEDCDCENNTDCASKNTTNGQFDPSKHRAMRDLMKYIDELGLERDLLSTLRSIGYDVIMVNHPKYTTINIQNNQTVNIDGGAYYIESNAFALVKLISQIRQMLILNASTSQIAIVGPSMGGQISRYALAYMEKNNIPHNTYLWVSIDSPHLGANIPMGDQALLNLVKGSSHEAKDFYEKELSSPAAQQQLIEFHKEGASYHLVNEQFLNAQTTSQGMTLNRGNTYFQKHYYNQNSNGLINSNGWPMNLRKVALINGSLSGSKETVTANGQPFYSFANNSDKVLNLRGFQRVNIQLPIGSITFRIHIASLEANFLPSSGSANTQIARFKKLFNDRTTKSPNYNLRGNMDNAPGGFYGAQNDIVVPTQGQNPIPGTNLNSINNWSLNNFSVTNILLSISERLGGSEWYLHEFNPIHSFIPTFSAIAHLQPNQSWSTPLNYNLKCSTNNQTPFDSYFGSSKNSQHTSFTKESVTWLLKELAGQPQAPWFPLTATDLSGLDKICTNTNTIYSFGNECKIPSSAIWTVSSNLQIISSTNYSVTIKGIDSGEGTITATFSNGMIVNKTIWIGKPSLTNFTFGGVGSTQSLCIATTSYSYSIPQLNSTDEVFANFNGLTTAETATNTNWEWQTINNIIVLNGTKNSRHICALNSGVTGVSVRVKNTCGWSDWYTLNFQIFENATPIGKTIQSKIKSFKIYPNPTNTILNIEFKGQKNKQDPNSIISAKLYNILAQEIAAISFINNSATIDVSSFQKGIYVLKINIDGQVESHQIAVE